MDILPRTQPVMAAKKILMLVGDFVEDYEVMVPFQALLMVGPADHGAPDAWNAYVGAWVRWNHVRAASSLAGSACLVLGLLR